jgi:hypothetical protein
LLADRVGKRLISGGDVEIAQRIRGAGYALRYTPEAVLRHRIPRDRASLRYLLRVNHGLGAGSALVSALTWQGNWPSWRRTARWRSVKTVARAFRRLHRLADVLASLSFAIGFVRGISRCIAMEDKDRQLLLGAAAHKKT